MTDSERQMKRLEDIPNVGKAIAADLRYLGVKTPSELSGKDPYELYNTLCERDRRPPRSVPARHVHRGGALRGGRSEAALVGVYGGAQAYPGESEDVLSADDVEEGLALLHLDRVQGALERRRQLRRVLHPLAVATCRLADHLEVQRR